MTPRKAGSEEPPAPPPCELCEQIEIDSAFSWCGHRSDHTLDLHADIAELRALLDPLMDGADWHVEGCACSGCVWFARARAALAPKEGRE